MAFFASASIFFASARFLPTGYDSSSVVETIATFFLSTVSICGITFFSDELVHSTATSGLPALDRADRVVGDADAQLLVEADHLAEIEADLGAVDVDRADNLESLARGHLARHRRADRAQARTTSTRIAIGTSDYIAFAALRTTGYDGRLVTDRKRLRRHVLRTDGRSSRRCLPPCAHPAALRQAPQRPSRRNPGRSTAPQPLSPRNANYDIDVTLDPAARTLTGSEIITWRNTGRDRRLFAPAAPLLERVPQHQLDLAEAAPAGRRRPVRRAAAPTTSATPTSPSIADRQRRRQRRRGPEAGRSATSRPTIRTPDDRSLAAADARRRRCSRAQTLRLRVDVDGQVPAQLRSHRRDRQLLLRLAVVPQARRVRGRRLDGAPVLRQHRVLLRLRPLRRAHDGAVGLGGRRHRRRAVAHRRRRRQDHASLRAGRCARLRVDDEPGLHRAAPSGSSMPGLPPVQMRLLLQPEHDGQADRHFAGTAAALRYYGEWYGAYPYGHITIVDPALQSESGGMEYPTLFTGGTRWLAPRQQQRARIRRHARSRPPVLVRHGRQQRDRVRVAGRGHQRVQRFARAVGGVPAELPRAAVLRRLHPVAVPRHRAASAPPTPTG